jgi:hypothetical protein
MNSFIKRWSILMLMSLSAPLSAQAPAVGDSAEVAATESASGTEKATASIPKRDKKLIQNATINLQTTVTGSQEQPRVLYILPWQSPESPELDIELLSAQQDAVFGHIEREELQRSLEAAGAMDQP